MTQDCFSDTFRQARDRFVTAMHRAAPQSFETLPHPLTGPDGGALATDVCHFGAPAGQATARLILSSGTHGIEGYAGSAIQLKLLERGFFENLPDHVGVTIIHAINPYGFAHNRRVNEDNVDLNRNFIDHGIKNDPENPHYAILNTALNPPDLTKATLDKARATLRTFVADYGVDAMRDAITQGQYQFPNGIFFGGTAPVWSNLMIRNLCRKLAAGLEHCVILDIHTGLGPFGVGEIILEDPSDSPRFNLAAEIWQQGVTSTRPAGQNQGAKSSSAALSGTIDNAFWQELAPATIISTALEFGTVDANQVSAALRDDNWLYAYGDPNGESAKPIKQAIRDAFYPQSEKWKLEILRQGTDATREAIDWLTAR